MRSDGLAPDHGRKASPWYCGLPESGRPCRQHFDGEVMEALRALAVSRKHFQAFWLGLGKPGPESPGKSSLSDNEMYVPIGNCPGPGNSQCIPSCRGVDARLVPQARFSATRILFFMALLLTIPLRFGLSGAVPTSGAGCLQALDC